MAKIQELNWPKDPQPEQWEQPSENWDFATTRAGLQPLAGLQPHTQSRRQPLVLHPVSSMLPDSNLYSDRRTLCREGLRERNHEPIVFSGMSEAGASTIELEELTSSSPPDQISQARTLLLEYGRFVITRPGAGRFCFGSLEKEAERLPFSYLEQGGGCMMAHAAGEPAGFVAWREIPANIAPNAPDIASASASPGAPTSQVAWELKRLWVRPQARGLGLGRLLTEAVLDRARRAGRQSIFLDTAPQSMGAAYRMYLAMGFAHSDKYNDNPVEGLAYLVKHL